MAAAEDKPPNIRSDSGDNLPTVDWILRRTSFVYALILLVAFISGAAWYSVFNAKKEEDIVQPVVKGPGGKPLPITKRKKRTDGRRKLGPSFGRTGKNVFRTIAAGIFLSYVVSGSLMFDHAFWHEDPYKWSREGLPWAGEWTAVSGTCDSIDMGTTKLTETAQTGPPHRRRLLLPLYPILPIRLAEGP